MSLKRFLLSVAGFCLAFCLAAEEYFDVRQRVQDWINTTYTGETKEEALERLRRISRAAKDDEAKIADMKKAFPRAFPILKEPLIFRKPLEWHVHSLALGYDIQEEGSVTIERVNIYDAVSDSKVVTTDGGSTEDKTKGGVEGYVGVDGKLSFPFAWAASIKGGGSLSFSLQSVSQRSRLWSRSQQQVFSRKASEINKMLLQKNIRNLHLSFAVTLTNNSDEVMTFSPANAYVPVFMDGRDFGHALPESKDTLTISPRSSKVVRFRLDLNTTTARELAVFMGKSAPTVDIGMGNFPVSTAKIRDVVAASSRRVRTIPVRLSLPIISGEWNIREKHTSDGRSVTLREALEAVEQQLSEQGVWGVFGWKGKRLDTLSSIPFEGFSPKDRDLRYIALVEMGERIDPVFDQTLLDKPLSQEGCTLWIVDLSQAKKYADESPALRKAVFSRVTQVTSSTPAQKFRIGELYADGVFTKRDDREAVKWYKEAADQGNALAQRELGDHYAWGRGVKQDHKEAAKWYRKSAEQGYAKAQSSLGWSYSIGKGVPQDYAEAAKWFRKAAEQNDSWAQCWLGWSYSIGKGVPQDYAEAVKWYLKSAKQGNLLSRSRIVLCYDAMKDYAKAAKWLRLSAEKGNSWAQCDLGTRYYSGKGVPQDYAEAVKWYRKSADQGNSLAQRNLGMCYYNGKGVPQNFAEAVKWYRKSAEQGDTWAQVELGGCYSAGKGVAQHYGEAVRWFRKSAEQGYAPGQCILGMCYYNGKGVEQDYAEAVNWFRKAVDRGYAPAQRWLGVCYYNGKGVEKDYVEAVNWFRKAANRGEAQAQYWLGWCYYFGEGVEKDRDEAIKWFRKAAAKGNSFAKKALDKFGVSY